MMAPAGPGNQPRGEVAMRKLADVEGMGYMSVVESYDFDKALKGPEPVSIFDPLFALFKKAANWVRDLVP